MAPMLDTSSVRSQFPVLSQTVDGQPLLYLDSAATAQKPLAVLEAMDRFQRESNANVHRGMHVLAERATVVYEKARDAVQALLNASSPQEIIFTKSCTEGLNLVAKSWGKAHLKPGDAVALSKLEHHSNIVPWLQLAEEIGIQIAWIDIDDDGNVQLEDVETLLQEGNVKLVSITGQSNVLGTIPPLKEIIAKSHSAGALVCIDAAQLITHHQVDVQDLDCDFLAFSGHKLYGPTGIGVLFVKESVLETMPPFLGGGMMISEVHLDHFEPADLPQAFEAGTPPITEAVGLDAAIYWLQQFDWKDIEAHEQELMDETLTQLKSIEGLKILGTPTSGCISFTIDNIHPHDLTEIIGRRGVCMRAGHHCAQPLHERLGISASTRASFGIYNTKEEIQSLPVAITEAINKLQ